MLLVKKIAICLGAILLQGSFRLRSSDFRLNILPTKLTVEPKKSCSPSGWHDFSFYSTSIESFSIFV